MDHRKLLLAACACALLVLSSYAAADGHDDSDNTAVELNKEEMLLKSYFKKGEFSRVVEMLEPLKLKTPQQYNMWVSALINIDLDDAEEAAEQFIEAHPGNYKAFHMHASVMGAQASSSIFSALRYAKKAKASLETATKLAPDNIEVYRALMQFHMVAPSIAGGDMNEAKTLAHKISEINEIDGKFAFAGLYLQSDRQTEAKAVYASLIENDATQIRARMELGSFYLSKGEYDASYDVLAPLAVITLPSVRKDSQTAWKSYQEIKSTLMYGQYRIGLLAVESGNYTKEGIDALEDYLLEYGLTDIDTDGLPSTNWARLRLAELYLNANRLDQAQRVVNELVEENGNRFVKVLKQLKKTLKKRAAEQQS